MAELFLKQIRITASGRIHLETNLTVPERIPRIDTMFPLLLRELNQAHSAAK